MPILDLLRLRVRSHPETYDLREASRRVELVKRLIDESHKQAWKYDIDIRLKRQETIGIAAGNLWFAECYVIIARSLTAHDQSIMNIDGYPSYAAWVQATTVLSLVKDLVDQTRSVLKNGPGRTPPVFELSYPQVVISGRFPESYVKGLFNAAETICEVLIRRAWQQKYGGLVRHSIRAQHVAALTGAKQNLAAAYELDSSLLTFEHADRNQVQSAEQRVRTCLDELILLGQKIASVAA